MIFPDANDRTPNQPKIIFAKTKILKLYKKHHPLVEQDVSYEIVKNWFSIKSKENGWDSVSFIGDDAAMEVYLVIK